MFNRIKNRLATGWRQRWAQAYIAFSPIGILIATALLSRSAGVWGWSDREDLGFLASLVPLGGVVYATIILVLEWGVRMVFWALAQREKDIEKRRAEGRVEGRAEARREAEREVGERIVQFMAERGIKLPEGLMAAILSGRAALLLESDDVYGGESPDVYIGRINQPGREFMAQQGAPPELPGAWCQRGWHVQLDRQYEEMLPAGRIQGLTLDTSTPLWTVSLA